MRSDAIGQPIKGLLQRRLIHSKQGPYHARVLKQAVDITTQHGTLLALPTQCMGQHRLCRDTRLQHARVQARLSVMNLITLDQLPR